ncbi:MAG: hypothetical protein MJE77_22780 [Proteobacteria bacterium]|nr:hypothetical protein [Pseudomonadota bacterium]
MQLVLRILVPVLAGGTLLFSSCSGPASRTGQGRPDNRAALPATTATDAVVAAPTGYVLTDARVFDLHIPRDLFSRDGRPLAQYPDIDSCHMQGASIAGDDLILSCVLYNEHDRATRTYIGKSFLLKTRLCDVVGCPGTSTPTWSIDEITEEIPPQDSQRITRLLLGKTRLEPRERSIVHLLTHPSGLLHDARRGGVWVSNAGYAGNTRAHLMLLDPADIGSGSLARAKRKIVVPGRHTNSVALVNDRYAVAPTWGSQDWTVIDVEDGRRQVTFANPLVGTRDQIDYQDCVRWPGPYVVCGGNWSFEADPAHPYTPLAKQKLNDPERNTVRMRVGRIQVLRFDVDRFPEVNVQLVGYWSAVLPGRDSPSTELGVRKYRYDQNRNKVMLLYNDYGGGYTLPLTLTYEGMAMDAAREYIYFVPADLPDGRLIRMRLTRE